MSKLQYLQRNRAEAPVKIGGGIDLEGLDDGVVYVAPEQEVLLLRSALDNIPTGTSGVPEGVVWYSDVTITNADELEPGDGYKMEIFGVTFDNVTMHQTEMSEAAPTAAKAAADGQQYVYWLGNPTLIGDEKNVLGLPDNGLPYLVVLFGEFASVLLREEYFAGVAGAQSAAVDRFYLWKMIPAHVLSWPMTSETWEFELEDGSTVRKTVMLSMDGDSE